MPASFQGKKMGGGVVVVRREGEIQARRHRNLFNLGGGGEMMRGKQI